MRRTFAVAAVAIGVVAVAQDRSTGPISAEMALPLLKSTEPPEICLRPDLAYGSGAAQARDERPGALAVAADWPGKEVIGGDVPPVRIVSDQYPTFDGMAVDPEQRLHA